MLADAIIDFTVFADFPLIDIAGKGLLKDPSKTAGLC